MRDSFYLDGLYVEHVRPEAGPGTQRPEAGPGTRRPDGGARAGRPPLLLVHGAGHGAWCWEGWLSMLPGLGWEAWALSLRNHPGSRTIYWEDYLKRLAIADYVDDVDAVLKHIARPAVVIGHSMGGLVTQGLAARRGKAGTPLAGMVLLTAAGPGALGPLRDAALPTDQAYWLTPEVARQRYFHSAAEEVVRGALARLVPESPAVMNEYSLAPGLDVKPQDIRCPALCVSAERDGTAVPRDDRLATYYGAEYLHYANTGHDVMLEANAAAILGDVLAWVERRVR